MFKTVLCGGMCFQCSLTKQVLQICNLSAENQKVKTNFVNEIAPVTSVLHWCAHGCN
jgi:hypothetical protein